MHGFRLVKSLAAKYREILSLPDAPHKIAQGFALGLAIDFFPLPLISIPVAYLLGRLFRANAIAAAISAACFKWAVPFFYAMNLITGSTVLGGDGSIPAQKGVSLSAALREAGSSFLVGAFLNAGLAWAISYLLVRRILELRRSANPKERNGYP